MLAVMAASLAVGWPYVAASVAGPSTGAPLYPDLRALPPSDLRLSQISIDGEMHHVVRFSTLFANLGQGAFEVHGAPEVPPDGTADATQRIYEFPAGFRDEPMGTIAYHPDHGHFHIDDFGRYELWTGRAFNRALGRGFERGVPLAVSDKVSFCMFDSERVDQSLTVSPIAVYRTCGPFMEGLSVGWADEYNWTLAGQWLDVGTEPLRDGDYVVRNIVDPTNRMWESDGKADPSRESTTANHAYTAFSIVGGMMRATS